MGVLTQKQKIFGNIAADKALTEGLPQLKLNSSFPSINNGGNSITFLTDLLKALIGFQELQQTVENVLTINLNEIEREIKNSLKDELKSIVNCGTNPSLPSWIKSTGDGIKFNVSKIDFTNLMFIDPNSESGNVLYNDRTPNLIDSTDFNTFLYQTIQNNGTIENWGHTTTGTDIITFKFKAHDVTGADPNNTITVKAHPSYDNKSLTEFNNNYIDSIKLFNTENILTNLIDTIFGSVSNVANKSLSQLENEAKINTVINKITNANTHDVINDKYFTFSNTELSTQQFDALQRKNGIKTFTTSGPLQTSVPFSSVQTMNKNIGDAINPFEVKSAVSNSLNSIGNDLGSLASNPTDANTVKLNFIQELINNLIKCMVDSILSPKVVAIFLINYKIIYGPNSEFTDSVDFLSKNRNLIHSVTKGIAASITKILMKFALREISKLVAAAALKKQLDKNKLYVAQLLTMVGVSPDVISLITQLL